MAITATSAATDGTTALGRARLADNFDTFLTLLTTQLKNQDPLSPLDSNQFTQQLVQMSGVEQQLLSNDLLKKLVDNSASGVATAVGLIGKEVRATGDNAQLADGKAQWGYKLDTDAADVKLEVLDSTGQVVQAQAAGALKAGDHAFTWNGKGLGGSTLPDGQYRLRVTATDGSGKSVASSNFVEGLVTAVEQTADGTVITINGGQVGWDKVTTIRQPTTSSSAGSS